MEEVFLSVEEAAEFLKISKSTLYKKKEQNLIPFHKFGKKILFAKSELIELIKTK